MGEPVSPDRKSNFLSNDNKFTHVVQQFMILSNKYTFWKVVGLMHIKGSTQ